MKPLPRTIKYVPLTYTQEKPLYMNWVPVTRRIDFSWSHIPTPNVLEAHSSYVLGNEMVPLNARTGKRMYPIERDKTCSKKLGFAFGFESFRVVPLCSLPK